MVYLTGSIHPAHQGKWLIIYVYMVLLTGTVQLFIPLIPRHQGEREQGATAHVLRRTRLLQGGWAGGEDETH